MANFWAKVNMVIEKADVILEVVDARFPEKSRNAEIEEKAERKGKPILLVLNKCDLADRQSLERFKKDHKNTLFISATERLGTTMLKQKILEIGKKDRVTVGIVGYPNTGKSSVANALCGRSKAKTSSESGYTHGVQLITAGPRIRLLDTPGVIPFMEKDEVLAALIGAKDANKIKDPELVALEIIAQAHGKVEEYYGIALSELQDEEITLERIAEKTNMLRKGGTYDTAATAKKIISDWQRGLKP